MVTLAMRPAFTSSRNCEYSIGACAAWRVLNWLNTVISTSPMTSQMTRFLSMLFKDFAPSLHCHKEKHLTGPVAPVLHHFKTPRYHVSLRRFTPGGRGFNRLHSHERPLHAFQHLVERLAVKSFDKENPVRLQRLAAKIDRGPRELEQARLVDVPDARQIRRNARQNHLGFRPPQPPDENFSPKIALQHRHPGDGGDRQKINRDDLPARLDLLRGHLRPAARRRAQVDHRHARTKQTLFSIQLEKLEGGARAITLLLRFPDVRIGDVAAQPLLAGFQSCLIPAVRTMVAQFSISVAAENANIAALRMRKTTLSPHEGPGF